MIREELEADFAREIAIKARFEAFKQQKANPKGPTLSSERINLGGPVMVQPGSQNTDTEQTDHMHLDGD